MQSGSSPSPTSAAPTGRSGARPRILPAVLALAIFGISVSGPLARLAEAPPLAIAVWRLLLSLAVVGAALLASGTWREWARLERRDVAVALAAGTFLALHFWSWIASLGMTSVAASVLLVNLHPVVIVAGSALWLRERPTRAQLLGFGLALLGAAVVAFAPSPTREPALGVERAPARALRDLTSASTVPSGTRGDTLLSSASTGTRGDTVARVSAGDGRGDTVASAPTPAGGERAGARRGRARSGQAPQGVGALPSTRRNNASTGNALALLGALTVGLYYLAGRSLRQRLSLWPYVGLVYGACAVVLLGLAALTRTPLWPYGPRELGIFALIALGPMLAGHTGFNWALRYVPAYVVSLALLAEPVGAAVIAALLPGIRELPSAGVLVGGAIVLAGLGLSFRGNAASS